MGEWLHSNLFGAVVGVLAAASLVAGGLLLNPAKRKELRLFSRGLRRPSGTPASYASRAGLGLGCLGGVVGFIYSVQAVPPHWAGPLLWTGFGVAMVAALAIGLTVRRGPIRGRPHAHRPSRPGHLTNR